MTGRTVSGKTVSDTYVFQCGSDGYIEYRVLSVPIFNDESSSISDNAVCTVSDCMD